MMNSGKTAGRNRRYPDFLSQRRNRCWAVISTVVIVVLATLGFSHLIANGVRNKASYSGDMLLRVFPKSENDKKFLHNFDSLNIDAQVWGLPGNNKDVPVYIYAKAGSMHRVMKTLHGRSLSFNVLIKDMQKLIDREEYSIAERRSNQSSELFDFENYHPYETIVTWLETLANTSNLISVSSMGKSYEGNDLLLVSISTNESKSKDDNDSHQHQTMEHEHKLDSYEKSNSLKKRSIKPISTEKLQEKAVIYINCGMHAREWIAISSCLWMINELVTSKKGSVTSLLLDTYDFWFVPVANPDGYIFSWYTDRLWRKNRSPGNACTGVDLNRNFNVRFNATSRNSCSSSYGGIEPESEEETKALIQLLLLNSYRIKATLFIHSFSQLWLSPYGVNSTYPKEYPEMRRVMSKAVNAIKSFFGTDFLFGSVANVLHWAPGTAIDYCYEKFGIVNSFIVELRDRGTNSFMLPLDEIKPTAIETWGGVIAMALAINEQMPQTNAGRQK